MRWTAPLLVTIVGCASTRIDLLPTAPSLMPVCTDAVRVFLDSTMVGKPYTEVARLTYHPSFGVIADETRAVDNQRKEAAKLGANGLVLSTGNLKSTAGNPDHSIAIFIPGDSVRTVRACKEH